MYHSESEHFSSIFFLIWEGGRLVELEYLIPVCNFGTLFPIHTLTHTVVFAQSLGFDVFFLTIDVNKLKCNGPSAGSKGLRGGKGMDE